MQGAQCKVLWSTARACESLVNLSLVIYFTEVQFLLRKKILEAAKKKRLDRFADLMVSVIVDNTPITAHMFQSISTKQTNNTT